MSGTEMLGFSAWELFDVALILGLAFGIYKKSRTCAVLMLAYFIVAKSACFMIACGRRASLRPAAVARSCASSGSIRSPEGAGRAVPAGLSEPSARPEVIRSRLFPLVLPLSGSELARRGAATAINRP